MSHCVSLKAGYVCACIGVCVCVCVSLMMLTQTGSDVTGVNTQIKQTIRLSL